MKFKNIVTVVLVSAATAFASLFVYNKYFASTEDVYVSSDAIPVHYASYTANAASGESPAGDFTDAANTVIPTTVHIKTKTAGHELRGHGDYSDDPLFDLFGGGGRYYVPSQMASGSGVIISSSGYIVTNNHVIDGADEIAVTLSNNSTYKAKVVGTDPNTDLAVLKIDAKDLPYIVFGNSNNTRVGQWVLACGYPLNLKTTVTAGIISAKSREIGINDEGVHPIESYLQTDAAVNPGNSGGPLVNTNGELIGINSAIASMTGSFAGYAYAIPSNLVKKVVTDIMKYGTVQRAYLGIQLPPTNLRNAYRISYNDHPQIGVKVDGVMPNGGAMAAGIQKGDVILKVNDDEVNSESELMGLLGSYQPGDVVKVTYQRDGKDYTANVTLKNENGTTDIVKTTVMDALGADFVDMPQEYAKKLGVDGGVIVRHIVSGALRDQTDMRDNFVILKAGNYPVRSVEELKTALQKQGDNVVLQGFYVSQYGPSGIYSYALTNIKSRAVN